jgi:glycosyltransferase involved in cell wall biosynthesis
MKTIVSITPLPVEADSRTYKEAASITRLGYRAVVVEGRRSTLDRAALPFELRDIEGAEGSRGRGTAVTGPPTTAGPAASSRRSRLPRPLRLVAGEAHRAAAWIYVVAGELVRTSRALPAASLYVLHDYMRFPAVYVVSRRRRVPFVYNAHDLYSWLLADQGEARSVTVLRNLLERLCVRSARACVTVGPMLARLQEERFGRPFAVIRNAHDSRLDEESWVSVREAAGVPPGAFLVVVIGNAKPSLAIREVIEASALLPPEVYVAFVGRGYAAYAEDVGRLGVADRVSFVGAVPPTQVRSFVRDADVAANVYVPASNGFHALPNGFFQSVAAGLPILYPRLPELEALSRRYELGLCVEPRDPADIAAQVERLRLDAGAVAEFRANANRAAPELSWEHEEREFARLIEQLA